MARRPKCKEVIETQPFGQDDLVSTEQFPASNTDLNPSEFDPALKQKADEVVQSVADSTRLPNAEPPANGFAARTQANGHIANPSSRRRESHVQSVRKLPSTMTVVAGDLKVELVDAGRNEMGIGIRVVTPLARSLTNEEKAIIRSHVKGEDGESSGFSWVADSGLWHKHILREGEHVDDVPPSRPVAIRLDAERRVQNLAEALREHAADPVGYAEMVRERREQAANGERIPD